MNRQEEIDSITNYLRCKPEAIAELNQFSDDQVRIIYLGFFDPGKFSREDLIWAKEIARRYEAGEIGLPETYQAAKDRGYRDR